MNYKKDGPLLFLSGKSYSRYIGYLDQKRLENEKIEQEKAHRKYMKEKSDEMANSWHDSIKNIKNREKEKLEMREKQLEKTRTEQVQHYTHFHQEERQQFLAEAKEKMKMKRYPNSILSNALLESSIWAENEAILKQKKEKQLEEMEDEAKWIVMIRKKEQEHKRRDEEEKCIEHHKSKSLRAFQLNQVDEKSRMALNEESKRLKEEQEILRNMRDEIEEIRKDEIEEARKRKMDMRRNMQEHFLRKDKMKRILKTEETEQQTVCDIYNDFYTKKVCGIAKQRNQEMNDYSEINRRLGMYNKRINEEKEARENMRYLNRCLEEEQRYQQEKHKTAERKEEMVKELNTYYKDWKQSENEENKNRADILRFKLAERLKDSEEIKKYDEQKQKELAEAKRLFAREWDKQIEEKKKFIRSKSSQNSTIDFYKIEDKKFLSYAKEVLEYARTKGMDEYPITREIMKYCKQNQLPPYPDCLEMKQNPLSTIRSNEVKLPKI